MKKIAIVINGEEYPCYFTMGAALEFRQQAGHEASEVGKEALADQGILLYCFCKSACRREGKEFPFSLTDFLCQITEDVLMAWNDIQEEAATDSKKKTSQARR